MSYRDGEILLKAQVVQVAGFSDANVARGDKWVILNSGSADHYAILRKGEHLRTWDTMRQHTSTYRTIIEVIQRINDTQEINYDACLEYADAIAARIDQYRKLADTTGLLRDANVTGGSEAKGIWTNTGDKPSWIMTDVFVDWSEESNVTFAE